MVFPFRAKLCIETACVESAWFRSVRPRNEQGSAVLFPATSGVGQGCKAVLQGPCQSLRTPRDPSFEVHRAINRAARSALATEVARSGQAPDHLYGQ